MAYIGLISDTHGVFDDKLRSFLDPVDEIWHAGDFGTIECADSIAAFKPLKGVRPVPAADFRMRALPYPSGHERFPEGHACNQSRSGRNLRLPQCAYRPAFPRMLLGHIRHGGLRVGQDPVISSQISNLRVLLPSSWASM